jgi:prevent-host-death family protein
LPRKKVMLRVVPASQAKNNFGEMIRRVYEHDEIQVVERAGLPVVGIVSMSDLQRLYPEKVKELPQVAASAKRERAAKQMQAFLGQMGTTEVPEAEVEADVMRAVQEVRHGKRKKTRA